MSILISQLRLTCRDRGVVTVATTVRWLADTGERRRKGLQSRGAVQFIGRQSQGNWCWHLDKTGIVWKGNLAATGAKGLGKNQESLCKRL